MSSNLQGHPDYVKSSKWCKSQVTLVLINWWVGHMIPAIAGVMKTARGRASSSGSRSLKVKLVTTCTFELIMHNPLHHVLRGHRTKVDRSHPRMHPCRLLLQIMHAHAYDLHDDVWGAGGKLVGNLSSLFKHSEGSVQYSAHDDRHTSMFLACG